MTNPIVVWAGDLHINSTVALCCPEFTRDNGDVRLNSPLQNALWEAWVDAWKEVKAMARGREVVTIIGGEIADEMIKHPSYEYITHNTEDIRRMALETLAPCLDVTNILLVLRGTEAHSGISSNLDEGIAREIATDRKGYIKVVKEGKQYSHYYTQRYIGGRLFDLAHHTRMGTARRTERNAANQLSADLAMDYVRKWGSDGKSYKLELPDFAMRGHVHRYSDSADNHVIRSIICPAWQMIGSYGHRISASAQASDIGLVVVEPAKMQVEWLRYAPKNQRPKHI